MFRNVTITGVEASLRWSYATAATLRAWTVTKTPTGWSLTATVTQIDHYKASQRPLTVVAPHEKGSFRWPVMELQVTGDTLTATLGPREV